MLSRGYYEAGDDIGFSAAGFAGIGAQMEAAGCIDHPDPNACFQAAVAAGDIQDPATATGQIANLTTACKKGGFISCTQLLVRQLAAGNGCQSQMIEAWHPNIQCDCNAPGGAKCTEVQELGWAERMALQKATEPPTAEYGAAKALKNVPPWAWLAGAGALGWLVWRMRR
jgi:hypothetical protein